MTFSPFDRTTQFKHTSDVRHLRPSKLALASFHRHNEILQIIQMYKEEGIKEVADDNFSSIIFRVYDTFSLKRNFYVRLLYRHCPRCANFFKLEINLFFAKNVLLFA